VAADDRVLDARAFADELTPLPDLGPKVSPAEADLAIARATCAQLRAANAVLQARNDQLHADRSALAARVRHLEQQVKEKKR
jgi:hypothetical protein